MTGAALKGRPGAPQWTAAELARLEDILDRGGLGKARHKEMVKVAKVTGRTVRAVTQRLFRMRRDRRAVGLDE